MKYLCVFIPVVLFLFSCSGQLERQSNQLTSPKQLVGGGCDGCELMYVSMPKNISHFSTSVGWNGNGQKLLIEGTVYQPDGVTPASGVIIYYWHTDENGLYSSDTNTPNEAVRHGKIRGWIKTGNDGRYRIFSSRPAPYAKEEIPSHIHIAVKEPGILNEYYLDWYFDDDKLYINHRKKYGKFDRGGTEILRVLLKDDVQIAEHNVILGLNIPHYPKKTVQKINSGLSIGEDQPSFIPYHAFGPDAGKRTCPVCKYGRYHGIVMFVGNNPDWQQIEKWLLFLENQSTKRNKYLKAYFVYGSDHDYDEKKRRDELTRLGEKLKLKNTALTFVPSWSDTDSEAHLNQINPNVHTTMIIYKYRTIINKFIDLPPVEENFTMISKVLDNTQGAYFDLVDPHEH
jgi:protocatechuate 3,4-dioxygenase, beta subunit